MALEVRLALVDRMHAACTAHSVELVFLDIPEPCCFHTGTRPARAGPSCARTSRSIRTTAGSHRGSPTVSSRESRSVGCTSWTCARCSGPCPAPPYWRQDLHMNLGAHAIAAGALLECITAM